MLIKKITPTPNLKEKVDQFYKDNYKKFGWARPRRENGQIVNDWENGDN